MPESSDPSPLSASFDLMAAFEKPEPRRAPRVPGYDITRELARGGMGAVYLARQHRPERDVALKVMLTDLADMAEMRARFQIEARALAALDHPRILPVYEVGEAEGIPFFAMKLVSGGTLAQRLAGGRMAPREAATLLLQIAQAVHFAHLHGTLHRDLKPANFLFDEAGGVYVSDFGLAKLALSEGGAELTRTDSFLGTPHYMPPEVAGGSAAGSTMAGDLYSLGAVFYECLCGRRPYDRCATTAQLLRSIVDDPVTPPRKLWPEIPRDLETICLKALAKSPSDRYPSVGEFAADLERWLSGRPITARAVGIPERVWSWARRHPLPAVLVFTLIVLTSVGSALLVVSHRARGVALNETRRQLRQSLIDQARSERLLKRPGHRAAGFALLRQAAELGISQVIRDEAVALLAHEDLSPIGNLPEAPPVSAPVAWGAEDPIVSSQASPGGRHVLAHHVSGRASLGLAGAASPLRAWTGLPGRGIRGAFTPDGQQLLLAETTNGTVITGVNGDATERRLQAPGEIITFIETDAAGRRAAICHAEGFEILDLTTAAEIWRVDVGPVRCAPAWSPDGQQLAAVLGETRGVSVFDASTGQLHWMQRTVGWPLQLKFHPSSRELACATDEPAIFLLDGTDGRVRATIPAEATSLRFSEDGDQLIANDTGGLAKGWRVERRIGFREWTRLPGAEPDGTVFGLELSADGRFVLSTATEGVRIWSVANERQAGFYAVENQRIDAPTRAWWLNGKADEILVQVPGGLERVPIDAAGRPGAPSRVPRQPGTTVVDVTEDGTWLVTSIDPDAPACEAWSGGDPSTARPTALPADDSREAKARDRRSSARISEDDVIRYLPADHPVSWQLIPPERLGVRACAFSMAGDRLFLLGREHRLFSWDLERLRKELQQMKF